MKTGEEKFDDEIRQKLRHSEVTPPAGLFDHIVPPKDKRRGFLWIWFTGIFILVMTALMVRMEHQPLIGLNDKSNSNNINSKSVNEISHSEKSYVVKSISSEDENKLQNEKNQNNEIINTGKSNASGNNLIQNYSIDNNSSSDYSNSGVAYSGNYKKKNKLSPTFTVKKDNNNNTSIYNYDLLYVPAPSLPYDDSRIVNQQIKILKPDDTEFDPHSPSPFGIELLFSKLYGYSKTQNETDDLLAQQLLDTRGDLGDQPDGFDARIRVTYALNNKFTLSGGIQYSELNQNFNFDFEELYDQLKIDTIKYYILFPFSPPIQITEYDSTIQHLSRTHKIENDLKFKSVSLAVEIRYGIPMGSFIIEPQAGLVADIYSIVDGTTNFNTQYETMDGDEHFENSIQAKLKGGIQLGYSLSEKYNIFINYEYQYALTTIKTAEPFYSEKINYLTLGAGIRYNFFKKQAANP